MQTRIFINVDKETCFGVFECDLLNFQVPIFLHKKFLVLDRHRYTNQNNKKEGRRFERIELVDTQHQTRTPTKR